MNRLIFLLLCGLLFAACQNTPKNASEHNPPTLSNAPGAPSVVTPEDIEEASANLAAGVKMMEELRKKVDALPASVKKEKAAEIEGYYSTLEGMIEKQTGMLNEINAMSGAPKAGRATQDTEAGGGLSPAQVQDYNQSAASYVKEAQAIQEALSKL